MDRVTLSKNTELVFDYNLPHEINCVATNEKYIDNVIKEGRAPETFKKLYLCESKITEKELCEMYKKLQMIEDYEEDLNIKLLNIFIANRSDTIYVKYKNKITKYVNIKIDLKRGVIWYDRIHGNSFGHFLELSDYGLYWALTEDELK